MRALSPRKPRAPSGTARFTRQPPPGSKGRAAGPWSPRQAAHFDLLRQFVRRNGHARVPRKHVEAHFRLGGWVPRLRQAHRNGDLSPEQERSLETLPGWSWLQHEDDFRQGLKLVKVFADREGHARVPQDHVERRVRLGVWVSSRRRDYSRGRLTPDRTRALEALPGWSWTPMDDSFEQFLRRLRRFVTRWGHARVPYPHRKGNLLVGRWVTEMRRLYASGALSPERRRQLEAFRGWTWSVSETRFQEGLRYLKRFAAREVAGVGNYPTPSVGAGGSLGRW